MNNNKAFIGLLLLCINPNVWAVGLDSIPAYDTSSNLNGTRLYVGAGLGVTKQSDSCNDPFFEGSCEQKDIAWKVFGGARFNPMLGVEASYQDMGKLERNGASGTSFANMSNSVTGLGASAVAYVPVMNGAEVFGKAGVLRWERDSSRTLNGNTQHSTDKGYSPMLGAGAQYQLNQNLYMRGEWEHTLNIGADSAYETDADTYSVGVMYSTL